MVEWVRVKSTAIRRIGYDVITMCMYVDFANSNSVYTFCGVPEHIFRAFVNARSKGQYYNRYVKDRYEIVKIDIVDDSEIY